MGNEYNELIDIIKGRKIGDQFSWVFIYSDGTMFELMPTPVSNAEFVYW